jgi:hypothetical protein
MCRLPFRRADEGVVLGARAGPQPRDALGAERVGVDPEDVLERVAEGLGVGQHHALIDVGAPARQRPGAQRDDVVGVRLLDDERLDEARRGLGRQPPVVGRPVTIPSRAGRPTSRRRRAPGST